MMTRTMKTMRLTGKIIDSGCEIILKWNWIARLPKENSLVAWD
ncbi:MAG: hypothetical protein ACI9J3_001223 [Parvicellaceae bacterium]|jgi:hypothetical protein